MKIKLLDYGIVRHGSVLEYLVVILDQLVVYYVCIIEENQLL